MNTRFGEDRRPSDISREAFVGLLEELDLSGDQAHLDALYLEVLTLRQRISTLYSIDVLQVDPAECMLTVASE